MFRVGCIILKCFMMVLFLINLAYAQNNNELKIADDKKQNKKTKELIINEEDKQEEKLYKRKNLRVESNTVKYDLFMVNRELESLNKDLYDPKKYIVEEGNDDQFNKKEKKAELEKKKKKLELELKELEGNSAE